MAQRIWQRYGGVSSAKVRVLKHIHGIPPPIVASVRFWYVLLGLGGVGGIKKGTSPRSTESFVLRGGLIVNKAGKIGNIYT